MNLIIDIGNSRTKYALIEGSEYIYIKTVSTDNKDTLENLLKEYSPIKNAIISSVKDKPLNLISFIENKEIPCIFFDKDTQIPIENTYNTKSSLGYDRLAASIGAHDLYPNTNILVIDAGTAITYDFINSNNQYCGGAISLGLSMRFKALNYYTSKLPLLEKEDSYPLIGKTTKESIISGVENGLIFEIDGYIDELKKKHTDLKIILTGGDAFFFEKKLKNCIFVDEKILLWGLNKIICYKNK